MPRQKDLSNHQRALNTKQAVNENRLDEFVHRHNVPQRRDQHLRSRKGLLREASGAVLMTMNKLTAFLLALWYGKGNLSFGKICLHQTAAHWKHSG